MTGLLWACWMTSGVPGIALCVGAGSAGRSRRPPAGAETLDKQLLQCISQFAEGHTFVVQFRQLRFGPHRTAQKHLGGLHHQAPSAGFVHTTLLRLAEPRREGVTDADIDEAWGRAARAWERMVAQRIELVTARSAALVQGTELVNLAGPRPRDFVLWEREGSSKA